MDNVNFIDNGQYNILTVMDSIRNIIIESEGYSLIKDYEKEVFFNRKTRQVRYLYPKDSIIFKFNNDTYHIKLNLTIWKEDYYRKNDSKKKYNLEHYMNRILRVNKEKDQYLLKDISKEIINEVVS